MTCFSLWQHSQGGTSSACVDGIQGELWAGAGLVTCPQKTIFVTLGWQLKSPHCLHAGIHSTLAQVQFCLLVLTMNSP